MSDPDVHIAAWEAAGLIDAPLAERLLQTITPEETAGTASPTISETGILLSGDPKLSPTSASSFFGPSISGGEMFAYLGVAFLLGAWVAFLERVAVTTDHDAIQTGGLSMAALAMFGLGAFLAHADPRRRRAAGVAFLSTTILAAAAATTSVQLDLLRDNLNFQAAEIFVTAVAVAVAIVLRLILPAVTTQLGLLGAVTGLAGAIQPWLTNSAPASSGSWSTTTSLAGLSEPVVMVLVTAAWWLLVAVGLGLLGLFEAHHRGSDSGALRRANISRFWASLVAVIGLASSITQSASLDADHYGRVVEPWIADLAILILAVVLVERAFRRGSTAYVLSAAIGLIVALTDFNLSYLSTSTDVGLLIEGVILLGVGFIGDRLRRRLDRAGAGRLSVGGSPSR